MNHSIKRLEFGIQRLADKSKLLEKLVEILGDYVRYQLVMMEDTLHVH